MPELQNYTATNPKAQENSTRKSFGIMFCVAMKQNWNFTALWISGMYEGRRMKHKDHSVNS